jgi:hypothetical protein
MEKDLTKLDEMEKLVWTGRHVCVVLGKLTPDLKIRLIPLGPPLTPEKLESMRGWIFGGCIGLGAEDNIARAVPHDCIDSRLVLLSSLSDYAAYAAEKLREPEAPEAPVSRDVSFLEKLWSLPDPR